MNTLRLTLNAVLAAEFDYDARCLVVWHELKQTEPALAGEILGLGFDEPTAARWVCSSYQEGSDSPAALVAMGRSAETMGAIYRTLHGFVG